MCSSDLGGAAVIYYGRVRTTGDVDIFYDRHPENAAKLFAVLTDFWGGNIPHLAGIEELQRSGFVLQFGVPPNRIDLINEIDGVKFADAWLCRKELSMPTASGAVPIQLISLSDLIRNKEATGRLKDADDAAFLRRVSQMK